MVKLYATNESESNRIYAVRELDFEFFYNKDKIKPKIFENLFELLPDERNIFVEK